MTNPTDPAAVETANRIVREFRPNGWPAKEGEVARLIARYGDQRAADERERVVAWLVARIEGMGEIMNGYIMAGSSLDGPQYRLHLGQHIAYMAMRSFISGCKRDHLKGAGE